MFQLYGKVKSISKISLHILSESLQMDKIQQQKIIFMYIKQRLIRRMLLMKHMGLFLSILRVI